MLKRLTTIWLLLILSALPAAAQIYQVAELIGAAIEQASDEEETMTCCTIAGQCQMDMQETLQYTPATDCPSQCVCVPSEPISPIGVLNLAPKLPSADEISAPSSPVIGWAEAFPPNALPRFSPQSKAIKPYLQYSCLRI